ncbi:PAS domain S-box protein [Pseudoalteromonas sp. SMS1]|uniref:PAS domain S-box protein n=1 Tax=Pseudoalteromonas sp. SMS1 TaxID=2908894 RepID=UPI001F2D2263|nr:PAS domain S-box protein [Pseudoalteromonas sp. SMS1]MCF2857081.1 PAS domain S-box protein [Pseudoalteromonas sp. SMS1]
MYPMKNFVRLPIALKIFVVVVFGLLAQVATLQVFTLKQTVDSHLNTRIDEVMSLFVQAQTALEFMASENRIDAIQKYLSLMKSHSDVEIAVVYNKQGTVLVATLPEYIGQDVITILERVKLNAAHEDAFLNTLSTAQTKELYDKQANLFLMSGPINDVGSSKYIDAAHLLIMADYASAEKYIKNSTMHAFTPLFVIMLVTALLVAFIFHVSIQKRLQKIFTHFDNFHAEKGITFIDIGGRDELSELARRSNILFQDLAKSHVAVSQQKDYFKALFEGITDAVVIVDEQGAILDLNHTAKQCLSGELADSKQFCEQFKLSHDCDLKQLVSLSKEADSHRGKSVRSFWLNNKKWHAINLSITKLTMAKQGLSCYLIAFVDQQKEFELTLQLQLSERKLFSIIENLPESVFLLQETGEVAYLNGQFKRFLTSDTKVTNTAQLLKACPKNIAVFLEQRMQSVMSGDSYIREEVHYKFRGDTYYCAITLFPIIKQNKSNYAMAGFISDITVQKKTDYELQQVQRRLAELVRHAPMAIIEWDQSLNIVFCNQAASTLFGSDNNSLIGNNLSELVAADFYSDLERYLLQTISNEHSAKQLIAIADKQGAQRVTEWHSFILSDAHSTHARYASLISDITMLHEVIESLELKEAEKDEVLQSMVDPVITINDKGHILTFNKAAEEAFQYNAERVIGENVKMLMPEEFAKHHDSFLLNYITTGHKQVIGIGRQVIGKRANGDEFPMHLSISELPIMPNGVRRFIGNCVDLTNIKEKEEQLRRSMKMDALGKLTGGIAHDFNNLIGIMLGYSDIITMQPSLDSEVKSFVQEIIKAGERATNLTQKLLNFSKKESALKEVFSLNDALLDSRQLLEKSLKPDVKLIFKLAQDLPDVQLDKHDFDDMILNLVINSVHAIEDAGSVTVRTSLDWYQNDRIDSSSSLHVKCEIIDTGEGIPEQNLDSIFDPFFSTKGDKGTGLGLSQVYAFIQRSLGCVEVKSNHDGTTFAIYFPAVESKTKLRAQTLPQYAHIHQTPSHILVVDDEASLADVIAKLLRQVGHTVDIKTCGVDALAALKDTHYDLLISDVLMPDVNGFSLVKKAQVFHPHIKVQMISGYVDIEKVSDFDSTLYANIIRKPFRPQELLNRIAVLSSE